MSDLTISLMERKDIFEAARTLSLAMLGNPIHVAVFRGQADEARLEIEHMFGTLLRDVPGVVFLGKINRQIVGLLRMKSCDGSQSSDQEADEEILEDTASRISHWKNVWAHNDPLEPHWHLGPVGVLPSYQGIGFGTALMRRFCNEVDTCNAAAYLETDRSENIRFYQKFGFQVADEADIFGVKNYFMWRSPRL